MIYIAHGGCGDDSFIDFRNWLISRGRTSYEKAIIDPDGLADETGLKDGLSETFGYVPARVYEELTGKEIPLPPSLPDNFGSPRGDPFSEDADELRQRFPKTWNKFGWDG